MSEVKQIPLSKLEVNNGQIDGLPKNPRFIKDYKFQKLKKSLEDSPEMLNLRELIVFPHGDKFVIIGGNMRYRAAKELKFKELPCKILSKDTPVEKLKEYTIKDNNAFGEYDWDDVANEWDAELLTDWGTDLPTGWDEMTTSEDDFDEEKEIPEDDFDEEKEKIEKRCEKGDVWKLGKHRLFVGDCTVDENIKKLMDGERADITFSSPPYNMCQGNIQNIFKSKKVKKSYDLTDGTYNEFSDALNNEDYAALLINSLKNGLKYCDDVLFNIGILSGSKSGIIDLLNTFKQNFCDILIWNKNNSMPLSLSSNKGCVSHRCELIFCFNQKGTRSFSHPQWDKGLYKGKVMINRIDTENSAKNEYAKEHHATFPVSFAAEIIKLYTEKSVLELFGGTGTTLIAAEQLNRKCFICELDPHYCDIILTRWEKLTGGKAEKITD